MEDVSRSCSVAIVPVLPDQRDEQGHPVLIERLVSHLIEARYAARGDN